MTTTLSEYYMQIKSLDHVLILSVLTLTRMFNNAAVDQRTVEASLVPG